MSDYNVVVAGGTRARFFTLESVEFPEMQSGPNLVEQLDMVNRDLADHSAPLWTEAHTGRNRGAGGGPAHGYDDHREQHIDEFEHRFARDITDQAARMALDGKCRHVVLVAHKRMLGYLRNHLDSLQKTGAQIHEYAKDLAKLPPLDLHDHLSREHLLPPRRQPA
jgi:protein required for attachment to host cells